MNNDIINKLNNCYNEFQNMLLSDKFISQKEYNKFLDKYHTTLEYLSNDSSNLDDLIIKKGNSILNNGYYIIEKRNNKFVNNKLVEYKNYFDNMYKQVDSNILLDENQRKAIISDDDYSLIAAGAGAGKTTTIIAKIKYLIEKCNIDPKDILLISYTNKATDLLKTRLNQEFNLNIDVLTFHKLGTKILKKRTDKTLQNIGDEKIYKYISDYVTKIIFKDKEKLKLFIESFNEYVTFDDDIFKYNTFDEYYKNYINTTYESNKDDIEKYIIERIKTRIKNKKSIDGKILRSKQEVLIANYLYKNGYKYDFKKSYPHKLDNNTIYEPDFTIINDDKNIYIEYYGLTKLKNNNKYTVNDIKAYNNLINKKRQLHEKYDTDLIEIYSDYENGKNYIDVLEDELNKRNINHTIKTKEEIFDILMSTSFEINYFKFVKFALNFINKYKENDFKLDYFDELISQATDDKTKNQLSIMKEIYISYNKTIHSKNLIDYNDIINYSYNEIEQVKEHFNFKYIIIDEFQDISNAKYKLVKKISDIYNSKVVAVEDDWQAIFSLSNINAEVFDDFNKEITNINEITTTYRNSQELVNIANKFINTSIKFDKNLSTNIHINHPVEICYYYEKKGVTKSYILSSLIKKIYTKNKNSKILLLGRYSSDIDEIVETPLFSKGPNNKIIYKKEVECDIEFLPIQKSKGLEYDNVIVLNCLNSIKGFPSKKNNDNIIGLLTNSPHETISFAEERKLFYVALTRTKEKVYMLTPYKPTNKRSEFILELVNIDNVKENTNYIKKYIEKNVE